MKRAFTDIFVQRPVLSLVVTLLIVTSGIQAINSLTVRQYPETEFASVTVRTVYVGADAELVRGFVTTPLERAIATADGIDYLSSTSEQGLSTITARLDLDYDANKALAEISSKVDQVRNDLPEESEVPEINIETAENARAAAYLSFNSEILQANEITDYLRRVVQPRLNGLSGVQEAEVLGERVFAMRIWLDPARMAALGVSATQVREALAANNFLSAIGQTKGNLVRVNLNANTDLNTAGEFKQLAIFNRDDTIVRIGDVAQVELGGEDYNSEVRFSGDRAVFIGIQVLPNANTVDVIREVREELDSIREDLPTGLKATVGYDSTIYIQAAINEVLQTLLRTLGIVMLVIFLFMGRLRSVLVPVVAIPISLIGAVFLMQVLGFTINLLTLLAVVLAVGLVVDDAIIVVENIERHIQEGKTPFDASMTGVRELIGPVIATTTVILAAFIPIAFQGGLTGAFFYEFALTLCGAIVISTIVALTLSPMLASKVLQPTKPGGVAERVNSLFTFVSGIYARLLDVSLQSRWVLYTGWTLVTLACVPMFIIAPKELAPEEDQGVIFGIVDAPPNQTVEENVRYTDKANDIFFSFPETNYTFQLTNPTGGFSGMVLEPWNKRERTTFELEPIVQKRLSEISGLNIFPTTPDPLPGGAENFPVNFLILSTDEPAEILEFAREIRQRATKSGFFAFPLILDTKIDQPRAEFKIDRDLVNALGLDLRDVGADLNAFVGGNFVNRFNIAGRSYKVIPQVERISRLTPEQLRDMYIRGPEGELIQFNTIAEIEETVEPRSLNRFQQFNAVKLSGVAVRPLDDALGFLEDTADEILPQGYRYDYTGESRQLRKEAGSFLAMFALALIVVFLVLSAQFNSFRDPLVILLGSVPLATFGALIFAALQMNAPDVPFWTNSWTTTLNIYSQVGLVTLAGVISKNGIIIVEFANQLQSAGKSKLDAIREAARIRFRPVVMTSFATIGGFLPLIFVSGAGAESRNSIGLIIVGGMAVGTVFTLLFLPSLYVLIAKDRNAAQNSAA